MYSSKMIALSALAAMLAAGGMTTTAAAQQAVPARPDTAHVHGAKHRGPAHRQRALFQGIDLSDAQRQQIKEVRARYRDQWKALHDKSGSDRQALRTERRQLMERQTADIRALLTPDQRRTFDQNMKQLRARMQDRARDGARGERSAS